MRHFQAKIGPFPLGGKGWNPYAPAAVGVSVYVEACTVHNWGHALTHGQRNREETRMASRRKKAASGGALIISKARTKAATKKCNVGAEFYGALDKQVRASIAAAEARAIGNKRKTLKAVDL